MLKKSIFFFLSFFCCLCVQAQHITYPESVKQLMEQADATLDDLWTICCIASRWQA